MKLGDSHFGGGHLPEHTPSRTPTNPRSSSIHDILALVSEEDKKKLALREILLSDLKKHIDFAIRAELKRQLQGMSTRSHTPIQKDINKSDVLIIASTIIDRAIGATITPTNLRALAKEKGYTITNTPSRDFDLIGSLSTENIYMLLDEILTSYGKGIQYTLAWGEDRISRKIIIALPSDPVR